MMILFFMGICIGYPFTENKCEYAEEIIAIDYSRACLNVFPTPSSSVFNNYTSLLLLFFHVIKRVIFLYDAFWFHNLAFVYIYLSGFGANHCRIIQLSPLVRLYSTVLLALKELCLVSLQKRIWKLTFYDYWNEESSSFCKEIQPKSGAWKSSISIYQHRNLDNK